MKAFYLSGLFSAALAMPAMAESPIESCQEPLQLVGVEFANGGLDLYFFDEHSETYKASVGFTHDDAETIEDMVVRGLIPQGLADFINVKSAEMVGTADSAFGLIDGTFDDYSIFISGDGMAITAKQFNAENSSMEFSGQIGSDNFTNFTNYYNTDMASAVIEISKTLKAIKFEYSQIHATCHIVSTNDYHSHLKP